MLKQQNVLSLTVLVFTLGSVLAKADVVPVAPAAAISDTLIVRDTLGLYSFIGTIPENKEPNGKAMFSAKAQKITTPFFSDGGDVLSITSFKVVLTSDANTGSPDVGEFFTTSDTIFASSNGPSCTGTGISDCLIVNGNTQTITEAGEAAHPPANTVSFTIAGRTIPIGTGEPGGSDTLTISDITVTLKSDNDTTPAADAMEFSDKLTYTVLSDVPEPASLIPMAGIMAVLSILIKRSRKAL